jgi:hypothetical protein
MRALWDDALDESRLGRRIADLELRLGALEGEVSDLASQFTRDEVYVITDAGKASLGDGAGPPPSGLLPIVCVDLDGVLADFNTAFLARLCAVSKWTPLSRVEFYRWDWPASYFTPEEQRAAWTTLEEDAQFWGTLGRLPAAHELLRVVERLAEANRIDLVFLTSRPETEAVRCGTERWLRAVVVPPYRLAFAEDKAAWIAAEETRLGTHVIAVLDDKPEHVEAIDDVLTWPYMAYLWDTPWNQAADLPAHRLRRPEEWAALLDILLGHWAAKSREVE